MSRTRRSRPCRDVVPGVDRLGDHVVTFYLIHHPDGLVLVDAGLPAHLGQLRDHLAETGHTLADVRAVLLTHTHPDHTGLAHALRQAGADVWVDERDAPVLRDGPRSTMRHARPERSMLPYLLRRPVAVATPLHLARSGAFTAPAVPDPRVFRGDGAMVDTAEPMDTTDRVNPADRGDKVDPAGKADRADTVDRAHTVDLVDVPGTPRAVALPGHTPGSTGYLFADRGLLFTGDALVTYDGLTGHTGPTVVCPGFTHDSAAALAALDRLAAALDELTGQSGTAVLLPGHGEPVTSTPEAAVREARRSRERSAAR